MLLTLILIYRVQCMFFLPVHLSTHFTMTALRVKIRHPVLRPIMLTVMHVHRRHPTRVFGLRSSVGNCMRSVYSYRERLTVACKVPQEVLTELPHSWVLGVISFCAPERWGPRASLPTTFPQKSFRHTHQACQHPGQVAI